MWQLFCFPLCPFSRKVRLALSEKGVGYELRREYPWDGSDEFYACNPAGRTPVASQASSARCVSPNREIRRHGGNAPPRAQQKGC